jgi:hypothetical protein
MPPPDTTASEANGQAPAVPAPAGATAELGASRGATSGGSVRTGSATTSNRRAAGSRKNKRRGGRR